MDPLLNNTTPKPPVPAPMPPTGNMPNIPAAGAAPAAAPAPAPVAPAPAPAPVAAAPSMEAAPAPVMSVENAFVGAEQAPSTISMGATEPLTQPDPIPEPDPIEEALKAPIRAADPVPGSIGSAVSVPSDTPVVPDNMMPPMAGASVPTTPLNNVAFNTEPTKMTDPMAKKQQKNQKSIIIIAIIGVLLLVGVGVAILIMTMNNSKPATPAPAPIQVIDKTPESGTTVCTYEGTDDELALYEGATSFSKEVRMKFDNKDILTEIKFSTTVGFDDVEFSEAIKTKLDKDYKDEYGFLGFEEDPYTTEILTNEDEIVLSFGTDDVDDIDDNSKDLMSLINDEDGNIDLTYETITETYTNLGFTCEDK